MKTLLANGRLKQLQRSIATALLNKGVRDKEKMPTEIGGWK